ncbi:MAG: SMP-30/gluconolactonase/LRE family protein [Myxococcales bacterium]|nr:SMP-30/gluconolactonase/LRE family protein [Myxococcales bacterium]
MTRVRAWLFGLCFSTVHCGTTPTMDASNTTDTGTSLPDRATTDDGPRPDSEPTDSATTMDATVDDSATDSGLATDTGIAMDAPTPADVPSDRPTADAAPVNPLNGIGAVEMARGGYMFTEGPQWREREGDLLFSDIPANTIHRLVLPMTYSMFRMPSDNSNGLAVDGMGRVLAAEHGSRSITRTRMDGSRETLARDFMEGGMLRRLNSPNDLVVRSDGTIYFTDPPYGLGGAPQELSFNGVFRRAPSGTLTAEWRGARATRPNGIVLSPDERTLYFANTADGIVRAMDVAMDGSLSNERTFVMTSGNPDGMAIDRDGNLFVTTSSGVQVFSPTGRLWGTIAVPMQPANCAFGAPDARTLFITARTALYRVRLARPGIY